MTKFKGTSGDDVLVGSGSDDIFTRLKGGHDDVSGKGGDDRFEFENHFGASDTVNGNGGTDTLVLNGDYGNGVVFLASTMKNVEVLQVLAGHDYSFTIRDENATGTLLVDGYLLTSADDLTFDGSDESDAAITVSAGAGNDLLTGGGGMDTFDLTKGGDDVASGGAATDSFFLADTFTASDSIEGGEGLDIAYLSGDYGMTISGAMLGGIETLVLSGGTFDFVLDDSVVTTGESLYVSATGATSTSLDASAETDATINFADGAGNDTFTGGGGSDFAVMLLGSDTASGGAGDDYFSVGAGFDATDRFDGGAGADNLILYGDYSTGLTIDALMLSGVESITLVNDFAVDLTFEDGVVSSGGSMTIYGANNAPAVRVDASAERDGTLTFFGGAGADTVLAGAGDDTLDGGLGDDVLRGGAGEDRLTGGTGADVLFGSAGATTYAYRSVAESTGAGFDHLVGFKTNVDTIDLDVAVGGVDASVTQGALTEATFDADLAFAVDSGKLDAGFAVIFKPDAGDYSGRVFLVVDANGVAGYQAGVDYVMQIDGSVHLNALSTGNFI